MNCAAQTQEQQILSYWRGRFQVWPTLTPRPHIQVSLSLPHFLMSASKFLLPGMGQGGGGPLEFWN